MTVLQTLTFREESVDKLNSELIILKNLVSELQEEKTEKVETEIDLENPYKWIAPRSTSSQKLRDFKESHLYENISTFMQKVNIQQMIIFNGLSMNLKNWLQFQKLTFKKYHRISMFF